MTPAAATVTAVSVVPFDEFSPRYRCCCGCCHVRCGAFIIAILQAFELVSLVSKLGNAANHFDEGASFVSYIPTILSALYFACFVVCVVYLFLGLCKGKSSYLTPMLIMLLFIIGFYLVVILFVIIVLAAGSDALVDYLMEQLRINEGTEYDRDTVKAALKITSIIMVIALIIGALIEIWWYLIIKACRTYLRDKEDWLLHHPGAQFTVPGGQQMDGVNVVLISQQPIPPQHYPPPPNTYASAPVDDHFGHAPPTYNDAMNLDKSAPPPS